MPNTSQVFEDLQLAAQGDEIAWQRVLREHHGRLYRMVAIRLDVRLTRRLDPDDILQDVYLDAARQLAEYLRAPHIPFFLWLRLLTGHWIGRAHRQHLGAQARDVSRERFIDVTMPNASSFVLAAQLMGHEERPSEVVQRDERVASVQAVLDAMDLVDREVLALRHFEQLSRAETAKVLNISEAAASKRYYRALARLKNLILVQFSEPDNL